MTPKDHLKRAVETFEEKGKVYGDSYAKAGKIMAAFFPDGLDLRTEADFSRYQTLQLCIMKLNRYTERLPDGGHKDSAHDLIVYAAILEHKTEE